MFIKKLLNPRKKSKIFYWAKLVSVTGSAQLLVQVATLLCGLIIIRLLSQQEYALYTIANTMLGTMTILADGGITSGVMAEGGKVWQNKERLGTVLETGLDLRKKFAIGSLVITIPILVYLLREHGASGWSCLLISAALIPAFYSALSDSIYGVIAKLHQDIRALQKNQLLVACGRLLLSGALLFSFPWTFVALIANGVPRSYGNVQLRKISSKFIESSKRPDRIVRGRILKVVKRVLPGAIYYCVSGQITLWLISFFGNTSSLASFGALGRIIASFAVINTVFSTLFVPRFAKLPNKKSVLVKWFLVNQFMLFAVCFVIVLLIYALDSTILMVLGSEYSGLENELVLISISGCLGIVGQSTNALLASRGLIVPPLIFILTTILVQVGAAFVFPIGELHGVILYGITTVFTIYLIRLIFFYFAIDND